MSTFARSRTVPAEVWKILAAPGALADAERRFGPPLLSRPINEPESRYHVVGRLVVIPSVKDAEILRAFKELSDEEESALMRKIELHVGHAVWDGDDMPRPGSSCTRRCTTNGHAPTRPEKRNLPFGLLYPLPRDRRAGDRRAAHGLRCDR